MLDEQILDPNALQNLLSAIGDDKAFLAEMIDTFQIDSPKLIAAMYQALASNQTEDFRRAAHTLKSNSATFGAMNLSRMAKELEEMGKASALAGAAEKIAQVESEYARVQRALQDIRTRSELNA